MKKFNKNKALNKIYNKRNKNNIKKISIVFSTILLVVAIIYFSFARFESTNTYSLISGKVISSKPVLISEKMISLANNRSTDLEYDGTATLGENGTEDNNLRYVGANPNNYIYFNCSTTNPSEMNDSTCEKWRIIGLFNNIEDNSGNSASRIRIIRNESIGKYAWYTSDTSINSGRGINQWGPSGEYEGADLMRELNTDYLGNITVGTDGKWYSGSNNLKTGDMPSKTLNFNAQDMIQEVKWNTGSNGSNEGSTWTTKNMYTYERSENTGKICSSGTYCNDSVERSTSWIGKVALMYPSDYGYATVGGTTTNKETCLNTTLYKWNGSGVSDCKNNSWLKPSSYQWTLSPRAHSYDASYVFYVGSDGLVGVTGAYSASAVRPAVFLQSSVFISGGNGSSEMPYKLEYNPPTISEKMISLANNKSTDLEYDGVETLGVNGTEDNNLRYVGATPNNYVYFNCDTTNPSEMNDSTCEKWRIIGLFNNIEDNNGNVSSRVKIIRDQSLGNYSWDSSDSSINEGYGINQWGASGSYDGADLMRELNTDYLGNITVGTDSKWYNGFKNSKTAKMPSKTLNSNAQDMIQEVKWKTGSDTNGGTSTWTTRNMYTYERSENTGKICSSGTSCNDSEIRTTSWIGKVALMYPSDYGYATVGGTTTNKETCLNTTLYNWDGSRVSDCKNNSWLKSGSWDLTLSPRAYSTNASSVFDVTSDGHISNTYASFYYVVRPAVFLQSSITIAEGNGSSQTPYKLTM